MYDERYICNRYAAELAAIEVLDRRYYLTPDPTRADRAAYARRQATLDYMRFRFYAELARLEQHDCTRPQRCRSSIRRSPLSATRAPIRPL